MSDTETRDPRRGTASINISRADKEAFDAIQWWLTHKMGHSATQWDVFSVILSAALRNKDAQLATAMMPFPR